MKVVRRIAVDVDEKELLLALNYDRNQYEQGYKDGRKNPIITIYKLALNPETMIADLDIDVNGVRQTIPIGWCYKDIVK